MKVFRSALQWLADSRLARGVVETLLRAKARRRVAELDRQSVARLQNRTLLSLVNKAHTTRFGREHDFRRIRTARDFRRLVPLRTPAELWREYWQPAYPALAGATWPGPIPYLAVAAAAPQSSLPYVPVTPELWAAQQTAAMTALAFVMHARPNARLCWGRCCILESGTTLNPLGEPARMDSVEAVALRRLPSALQPYALSSSGSPDWLPIPGEESHLAGLAERTTYRPVTCITGTADRLAQFFAHARRTARRDRLVDIWPSLTAVLYARGPDSDERERLERELNSPGVVLLEMVIRPEGAVAIEDPRHGRLRLLPDHGVYFEFVPVEQIGKLRPERLTAAEVRVGVPYALAVSSPAGVWACLVGSIVCFERLDPPLLRLLELAAPWQQPAPAATSLAKPPKTLPTLTLQPPHPRTVGSSAGHPGRPFRSALSIHVDRE